MVKTSAVIEQLDEWSSTRLRFHMPEADLVQIAESPERTLTYNLYRQALQRSGHTHLIDRYDLDHRAQDMKLLRNLSEYMKKKGQVVEKDWRMLVDLHRLNDYIKPPPVDEFAEDIRDWVQRKPLHTWNGDEEEWYQRFEKSMTKVLFRSGRKPDKIITVDEFVQNGDMWATSGSGFEPDADKLKVRSVIKNEEVEIRKNKWAVRWGLSNYKVKRLLFKRRRQLCKAVAKSEPAKVRAVISSDLGLYLKMTYVSTFLDQILRGRTDSTLWMSADDRLNLWQDMAPDGTWRMPLDQSEFDKNQTKRQVLITVKIIKELITAYQAPADMLEIMDLIIYALEDGYVYVGNERIAILNGVLSGWRWTALIDTLINLAELDMSQDWVTENSTIKPELVSYNAQGDDDWLKFKTMRGAVATWLAYESFGLFVNPGKFFLDTWRDEYLRRVMDNNVVTGYPARSVASIIFRDPTSPSEPTGQARIRSTFGKWKLFAERMNTDFYGSWFFGRFLIDSVRGTRGVTKEQVRDFVNLSAIYGGIGLDNKGFFDTLIPLTTEAEADPLDIEGEGYTEWVKFASQYGVDERDANRFAVSTLDLTGKFGIPKWIKYIYTHDELTTGFPHGLKTDVPGTVAIGILAKTYARKREWKWFKTFGALTHLSQFTELDATYSETIFGLKNTIHIPVGKVRPQRLTLVPGITLTLAQLSTKPELVYSDYFESSYKHLPRSWLLDWLKGRIKGKSGPVSGWGLDVTGHLTQRLLNVITSIFLNTSKPTLLLWKSLLASIDAALPAALRALKIRIVE